MKTREQRIFDGLECLFMWREALERQMNEHAMQISRHDPLLNPNIHGYLEARSMIKRSQPKALRSYLWLNPTGMTGPRLTKANINVFRWWIHTDH